MTSYWCLSAIIKDTKECTVINDCSLMTFPCNSEEGWVGLCTALIGQLGCYVASFQPSSLQANGCCACVELLEGPLPATVKGVCLPCNVIMCKLAGLIFPVLCVCMHLMCQYCLPFLSVPLLPCPSLQFTDQLLSCTVGTVVYPITWQVGRPWEGG